jgi:hypothetical protein
VNRHFVSAFQKVATFQKIGDAKLGGNVASYFCTSEGQVLHLIAGPVSAQTFLREARWVNEAFQLAQLENRTAPDQLRAFFRNAHAERLRSEHRLSLQADRLPDQVNLTPQNAALLFDLNGGLSEAGKAHLLLAVAPLPRIDQVYQVVFERILNEKISTNPVAAR